MASIEGAAHTQTEDDTPSLIELFQCPIDTLCDFGDIILVCNDGFHPELKIRVSSCILANSSKVFRALFSKRFAEGHAIHTGETNEIHVMEAPKPFLIMCSMLHHSTLQDAKAMSWDSVDLALLIDKYDCVKPLTSATSALLQTLLNPLAGNHCGDVMDCLRVATAAYILEQPEAFVQSTRKLLRVYRHGALDGYCVGLLPPTFLAAFQTQRAKIFSEITRTITRIVYDYTFAAHQNYKPNLVMDLSKDLSNLSLWPLDAKITSVDDALVGLANLKVPVLVAAEDRPYNPPYASPIRHSPRTSDRGVWATRSPTESEVMQAWNAAEAMLVGSPPQHQRSVTPQPATTPFVDTLTPKHISAMRDVLEQSCAGLCIDCLKGNEVCRLERLGFCERWQRPAPTMLSGGSADGWESHEGLMW
nr:hypothetical protein B0A51_15655 [Rachicladosporium sp. CCFEE 5018]